MKFSRIAGTGSYLPERKLTNTDLEKMVETNDEWIRERTGISCRRIAAPEQATSDLAYEASILALADAKMSATDIDAILLATATPDHSLPNTACILQHRLGCRPVFAVDLSAACSGFVYATMLADHMIRAGAYRNILIVGAETLSRIINYKDRQTCILFGDGAGAVILSATTDSNSRIIASDMAADGTHAQILAVPASGSRKPFSQEVLDNNEHLVHMSGKDVFKAAVKTLAERSRNVLTESELKITDMDWYLIHQANTRIIEALASLLGMQDEKILTNIADVGNTSSASIPILLDQNIRNGKIKRGQLLLIAAFGGGLTSGALTVKY